MTDTQQALLQNILDNPDDDQARLVYADFLEEAGEVDRAEFIRVQIRIAQIDEEIQSDEDCDNPGCSCCVERRPLRKREREIFPGDRWYPSWSKSDYDYFTVDWCRGFIHTINLSSEAWFAHHAEILAQHPVREVTLTTMPEARRSHSVRGEPGTWFEFPARFMIRIDSVFLNILPLFSPRNAKAIVIEALGQTWPKITFYLPVEFT